MLNQSSTQSLTSPKMDLSTQTAVSASSSKSRSTTSREDWLGNIHTLLVNRPVVLLSLVKCSGSIGLVDASGLLFALNYFIAGHIGHRRVMIEEAYESSKLVNAALESL